MKPLLTVIVVSNRVGGLDALIAGLDAQTFRDFELIFVDELWRERELPENLSFPARHRAPGSDLRWGNYMRSLNTGRIFANGERCVFWSDYTCPHPETLATHARFHETNPDDVMLGGIQYLELPKLHPQFPLRYGWLEMGYDMANPTPETYAPWLDDSKRHALYEKWRRAYERDLDNGTLDPFMWSTFAEPIREHEDIDGLRVIGHDRRDSSPFLNLKNDSIPKRLLDRICGFDERADGCHGHQDSITARQLARVGAKFVSVPENPIDLIDAHGVAIIRRMERHDASNIIIYEEAGS